MQDYVINIITIIITALLAALMYYIKTTINIKLIMFKSELTQDIKLNYVGKPDLALYITAKEITEKFYTRNELLLIINPLNKVLQNIQKTQIEMNKIISQMASDIAVLKKIS